MSNKKTDYKPQMSVIQEDEDIQALVDAGAGVPRLHRDEMRDPLLMAHLDDSTTSRSAFTLRRHGFYDGRKNTTIPTMQNYDDIFGGNSPAVDPKDPAGIGKMVIDKLSQPYSHKYSPMVLQNASNELSPAAMRKLTAEEQRIMALEAKYAEERRLADMESEFQRFLTSSYTPNLQASQSLREKYEDSRSAKRLADWWGQKYEDSRSQTHSLPALTQTEMKTPNQPISMEAPSAAANVVKPVERKDVMQYYGIE